MSTSTCERSPLSCFLCAAIALGFAVCMASRSEQAARKGRSREATIGQPEPNWEMAPCFNCAMVTPGCNRYC